MSAHTDLQLSPSFLPELPCSFRRIDLAHARFSRPRCRCSFRVALIILPKERLIPSAPTKSARDNAKWLFHASSIRRYYWPDKPQSVVRLALVACHVLAETTPSRPSHGSDNKQRLGVAGGVVAPPCKTRGRWRRHRSSAFSRVRFSRLPPPVLPSSVAPTRAEETPRLVALLGRGSSSGVPDASVYWEQWWFYVVFHVCSIVRRAVEMNGIFLHPGIRD